MKRRRLTLDQLRLKIIRQLNHEWRSHNEIQEALDLPSWEYWRIAAVLERLANDGFAELERPGAKVRRFRRRPR